MRKILLATDLETTAANVAAFALTLADNFGAELTVFHAFGKPDMSQGEDSEVVRKDRVILKLKEFMAGLSTKTNADTVIKYQAAMDFAGDGIIDQVEKGDFDLLVIGLREANEGESQFSSLAYRLLREAETAVLAVPPQAEFHGINEIVFASDVDEADEVVLEQLQEWRQKLTSDLFVVNVYDNNEDKENARSIMSKWRERYSSRPNMHFELLAGEFTKDIGAYVDQRGGDMLVLQSHTRGLLSRLFSSSSAAEVAHTVQVPLLIMRGEG